MARSHVCINKVLETGGVVNTLKICLWLPKQPAVGSAAAPGSAAVALADTGR